MFYNGLKSKLKIMKWSCINKPRVMSKYFYLCALTEIGKIVFKDSVNRINVYIHCEGM